MWLRSTVEDQEAERQRIARELHDSLGQTLTLLQLGLDELGQSLPAGEKIRERLAALKGLARGVGTQVNRLAWEIRPTALDDLGLETAIHHLIETWSERLNLHFDLRLLLNDRPLNPAIETTLYRVLQEAITNIARHANATRVAVLLEATEKEINMIVEDNGCGFFPAEAEPASKRLGFLRTVRERLSLVSGTLEVELALGQGCTLYIRVPLLTQACFPPPTRSVADDHPLILAGVRLLLNDDPEVEIVGEARDGETALQMALELKPAIMVLDLSMPGLNGVEVTRQLRAQSPDGKIVVLTVQEDRSYLRKLIEAGVAGYVLKRSVAEDLRRAIYAVAWGDLPGSINSRARPRHDR